MDGSLKLVVMGSNQALCMKKALLGEAKPTSVISTPQDD
ncbi:uncharacterized protein G2W53_037113 [Senna tora]|uniref:Uncharacterized protein n=1 Tax=Senna tora TaxID=362788 RepID=A0A834SU51_9FABA|nr:uncharacterized protein G2W53_037113 [Senna tora]